VISSNFFHDPGVAIGIALIIGMLAQSIAQHLKVPSIIVLLISGVALGPEFLGIVQPSSLGAALRPLVGFGVSVILFEGAMNLDIRQLRRSAMSIRQLSTTGVLITAGATTAAAHYILGWSFEVAILFGTLLTVTGPTVITPLVRRMRLQSRVATLLQAEGIFVDAIGAVLAVVALEVIIGREGMGTLGDAASNIALSLIIGGVVGAIGGFVIALLLRFEQLVPEGMQRVFALAIVLALFQLSNALVAESGILAVVAAGLVVGNLRTPALSEFREFKEQLTVLLLGLLFVLLAADVQLADVRALGWRGLLLVAVIMLIIRPANIWISTIESDLTKKEKWFLSFLAPRGIVAAAVASLFAESLQDENIDGGPELRAMVFLVILVTVIISGSFGGWLARRLELTRPSQRGFVILGAQAIGRMLAKVLKGVGEDVVMIDSNPQVCRVAEAEGLRVIYGSGLAESVQMRAELDVREGVIGLTTNDEVNLLFARRARKEYKVPRVWVSIRRGQLNVTPETVRSFEGHVLFAKPRNLEAWNARLERGRTSLERWINSGDPAAGELNFSEGHEEPFLPLLVQRGKKTLLVDEKTAYRRDDLLWVVVWLEQTREADERLRARGWVRVDGDRDDAPVALASVGEDQSA
jgi:NhaP-type Na+/H+ or K+/H+ antiporter